MQCEQDETNKRALVIGGKESPEVTVLISAGFQVDVVGSQEDACAKLRDTRYDMVVTLTSYSAYPCHEDERKHLTLLSETISRLLVTDDPQGLVQSLCEKVMEALGCHAFFNFLVDDDHGKLHLNAFAGIPEEVGKSIEWLDYGVAVCGCVARDGARIVAENIFDTPDVKTDLVKSYGIQAYACHPLLGQGGKVIGTLSFGSKSNIRFSSDELSLMKTVADYVATAMGRIRMLNDERHRAQELQAVLDAIPTIVWISHDPESHQITGSKASYELLRLPLDANASKSAPEVERPTNFRTMKNGVEIPIDQLPVQRAAKGEVIKDYEFELLFDDSTTRYLLGDASPLLDDSGKPRGSVSAFSDITERRAAELAARELEAHKLEFYRRTILAATEGKLVISDEENIAKIAFEHVKSWQMKDHDDVGLMRDELITLLRGYEMEDRRVYKFLGCVIEAAANALKHAGGGECTLCRDADRLVFITKDHGTGIRALELPDVALTRHYSTAGTLGMGYKLIIEFADTVYLATGPDGTTVAIEMTIADSIK